jgi:hypothetical protein
MTQITTSVAVTELKNVLNILITEPMGARRVLTDSGKILSMLAASYVRKDALPPYLFLLMSIRCRVSFGAANKIDRAAAGNTISVR